MMEILGYSQIALTMNTYSHVAPEVSRATTDRLSWGFSGGAPGSHLEPTD